MMRRWIWLLVVMAGVGSLAAFLALRDTATPVEAGSFPGAVGIAPGEPGVYYYATRGHEAVDALGGARHDYPAITFMTITAEDCGPVVRWQALAERWVEWWHCGPDLAVTSTTEHHEWFGVVDDEIEECPVPRPVLRAGEVTCVGGSSTEAYSVEVIGRETVHVAAQPVETIHIRRTSTLGGGTSGETVADVWRLAGTPLVVRLELASVSITSSAVGDVRYTEEVELTLERLVPSG